MSTYEHIAALVAQENPSFEAFYTDMCALIPALKGRGAIAIQRAPLKRALKTAYLAGDSDAINRLINSETSPE